jgi:hypothetical protein
MISVHAARTAALHSSFSDKLPVSGVFVLNRMVMYENAVFHPERLILDVSTEEKFLLAITSRY